MRMRNSSTYASSTSGDDFHVRGSTHLPMSSVNDWYQDLDHDRPLLLLCRTGNRSQRIAEALWGQAAMTNVINVAGGINAWIEDGNEVEG